MTATRLADFLSRSDAAFPPLASYASASASNSFEKSIIVLLLLFRQVHMLTFLTVVSEKTGQRPRDRRSLKLFHHKGMKARSAISAHLLVMSDQQHSGAVAGESLNHAQPHNQWTGRRCLNPARRGWRVSASSPALKPAQCACVSPPLNVASTARVR